VAHQEGIKGENVSNTSAAIRLTELSSCAGCAAKIGQHSLAQILRGLEVRSDPNLLIGSATGDDAGVYRIDERRALVQTLDFFTPIVDDPYDYGRIAATNALSDVYAMGGRPLTAMNIVGMPTAKLSPETIGQILRGGAEVAAAAGCCLVGGHSIRTTDPIYGLSVTGMVNPQRVLANTAAQAGDMLVLTKPLGTGVITTAVKRGIAPPALLASAVASMTTLNTPGAVLAEAGLVRAGTDVTGFGLLGHLANICNGSGVSAEVQAAAIPLLGEQVLELVQQDCVPGGTRTNLQTASEQTDWGNTPDRLRVLLCDAQTSGPLLLGVPPQRLSEVVDLLQRCGALCHAVIGRIVKRGSYLMRVI
jgi:selenide,water dikinase